ncbi:hypothetical protein PF008_g23489 [Phytophthora fragariae]|uniref:Uncharacterized protein n=1 Tax=Phytophthora fragariae TaxID=53985 RepID=A0A6G0QRA7_9STRA|nr:hypothetical protein PF008_g23489 [Phytophthora fragariae]
MRRSAWRSFRKSAWTWTVCETASGPCLSGLVTTSTACGTAARKAKRTTNRCAKSWNGTSTGLEFCMTVWAAWRPRRHTAYRLVLPLRLLFLLLLLPRFSRRSSFG